MRKAASGSKTASVARGLFARVLIYLAIIPIAAFAIFPDLLTLMQLWWVGALGPDAPAPSVSPYAGDGPYANLLKRRLDEERIHADAKPCDGEVPSIPPPWNARLAIRCTEDGQVATSVLPQRLGIRFAPRPEPIPLALDAGAFNFVRVETRRIEGAEAFNLYEPLRRNEWLISYVGEIAFAGIEEIRLVRRFARDHRLLLIEPAISLQGKPGHVGLICDPDCDYWMPFFAETPPAP